MLGQQVNWDYQWAQIVARAWSDEAFKQRLLGDPATVLQDYELTPPAGGVQVLEASERAPADSDGVLRLVLPDKPLSEDLSEDDLCSVGGAGEAPRCGCEWCRCERCHRCGWCGGCHHPEPEEG